MPYLQMPIASIALLMKNQYFLTTFFLFFMLSASLLVAQKIIPSTPDREKTFIAIPPPVAVRTMAEWEEVSALVISWKTTQESILTEIVRHAAKECRVYILTGDPLSVNNDLIIAGITSEDRENITYITENTNSIWMRDYGPWTIYHNDVGTLAFSDFLYNRLWRTDDDIVPYQIAAELGIPIYNADENPFQWVHTGGNFLRDGMGTAYSSDLTLRENSGKTGIEIKDYAKRFFGINDYRFIHRLPYDTIHHLDMHIRTLDEETLAVGWYPEGTADGPQIEANLDYIRQHFRTPFGNPYHIIRQQMPPQNGLYPPQGDYRTYTNGIFINKTFLVPIYEETYDSTALRIYRDYLPGYNVVGIDCNSIIDRLGALHCITKLIGVQEPLRITHPRLRDAYENQQSYPVDAYVQHISGIESVYLHYRLAGELLYDSILMERDTENLDHWQTNIPRQNTGNEVQYYIAAYANNGKKQVRPLPAPVAYYPFKIKSFEAIPEARMLQTATILAPEMTVQYTSDTQNGTTSLEWSFPGGEPAFASTKDVFVRYAEPGIYPVQLIANNPLGKDTLLLENAVTVKTAFAPFIEHFDSGISPIWEMEGAINWEVYEDINCHQNCLKIDHRISSNDLNRTYLRTALDLSSVAYAGLTFDIAYALRSEDYFDELRVNLVDENGEIFNVFNKGGRVLATVNEFRPDFTPQNCLEWRNEVIDLGEWEGQQVLLEFETIGDQGNNIYLDNISFLANSLPYVNITHPIDGTMYFGDGTPIFDTIIVDALDPDGSIDFVSFFVAGELFLVDSVAPYELIYEIPGFGSFCYQAKARDDDDLQVWAEQVCVNYESTTDATTAESEDIHWHIGPNPTEDFFFLYVNSESSFSDITASILDVEGRVLKQKNIPLFSSSFQYPFFIKELPKGHYFLQLKTADFVKTLAFIKQ